MHMQQSSLFKLAIINCISRSIDSLLAHTLVGGDMQTASNRLNHRFQRQGRCHLQRRNRNGFIKLTCCMAGGKPLAVISGVARTHGIGRECAKAFLEAGYKVVGLDNASQEDPALQHEDYHFSTTDITSIEQTKQVAKQVSSQNNALRVLINNAGIADPYLPEDPTERIALWSKVIQTNLTGAFLLSEALVPHMVPGQSSIIHMSSIRATQSEPNSEAYGAAKAGLIGLTHAQAVSLAKKVRVNAVLPGWIYTMPNPEELTHEDHDWHLSGRVGVTKDIAELCLFLADHKRRDSSPARISLLMEESARS